MGFKKRKRLDFVVSAIQRRWGRKALRRGEAAFAPESGLPHLPTGFPPLDQALDGIGGLPRGRISELLGAPTSGMATLALKLIEQAQAAGDTAAYLDLSRTFDPDYAARCHVRLSKLLLVRPASGLEALALTRDLIESRGLGVLVFDSVADLCQTRPEASALAQLPAGLVESACALIFLTPLLRGDPMSSANYPAGFALPHYASVRLLLRKERWLQRGRDICGYQARVLVLKNKLGAAGRRAQIAVTFNGVVQGDGT